MELDGGLRTDAGGRDDGVLKGEDVGSLLVVEAEYLAPGIDELHVDEPVGRSAVGV